MEEIKLNGYVVVRKAVSELKCSKLEAEFWNYLETLNPKIDCGDSTTWTGENLPFRSRGLIQFYGVGTQAHAVHARSEVKHIFEELYGTDKLLTSFDGTGFVTRPKKFTNKDLDDWETKDWDNDDIHIDQSTQGLSSIQGGLCLITQSKHSRVFLVVPGSHLHHEKLMEIDQQNRIEIHNKLLEELKTCKEDEHKKIKAKINKTKNLDLYGATHSVMIRGKMIDYLKERGLTRMRIPLNAGDFVLWDSRAVHSSAGFTAKCPMDEIRLQVFVCMAPIPEDKVVYATERLARIKAFLEGRTSMHSTPIIKLFAKTPHTYGKNESDFQKVEPYAELTEDEKKLHGLIKY